jgi:hypothetical protein
MTRCLPRHESSRLLLFVGITLPALAAGCRSDASPPQPQVVDDSGELRRLHDEDQADRSPSEGKPVDWRIVGPRDHARLVRVKELFAANRFRTANDYYHAAMILQHGEAPEDYLLAHEFCVVAIIKGKNDKDTRWLAASSEDRFLMNIGRPQRFATQFRWADDGPVELYQVDRAVTDELRRLMGAHSLAEAEAHAALNEK